MLVKHVYGDAKCALIVEVTLRASLGRTDLLLLVIVQSMTAQNVVGLQLYSAAFLSAGHDSTAVAVGTIDVLGEFGVVGEAARTAVAEIWRRDAVGAREMLDLGLTVTEML